MRPIGPDHPLRWRQIGPPIGLVDGRCGNVRIETRPPCEPVAPSSRNLRRFPREQSRLPGEGSIHYAPRLSTRLIFALPDDTIVARRYGERGVLLMRQIDGVGSGHPDVTAAAGAVLTEERYT